MTKLKVLKLNYLFFFANAIHFTYSNNHKTIKKNQGTPIIHKKHNIIGYKIFNMRLPGKVFPSDFLQFFQRNNQI